MASQEQIYDFVTNGDLFISQGEVRYSTLNHLRDPAFHGPANKQSYAAFNGEFFGIELFSGSIKYSKPYIKAVAELIQGLGWNQALDVTQNFAASNAAKANVELTQELYEMRLQHYIDREPGPKQLSVAQAAGVLCISQDTLAGHIIPDERFMTYKTTATVRGIRHEVNFIEVESFRSLSNWKYPRSFKH